MEFEELKCPNCKEFFDSISGKIPRLLMNCGHSLCENCIVNELNDKDEEGFSVIKCSEDEESYTQITNIDQFPKNITLIKLLNKSKETRKSLINHLESIPITNCNQEESTPNKNIQTENVIKLNQMRDNMHLVINSLPPNEIVTNSTDNITQNISSPVTNNEARNCILEKSQLVNIINNTTITTRNIPNSETKSDSPAINNCLSLNNNKSSLRIGLFSKQDSRLNFYHDKSNKNLSQNHSQFSPNDQTIFCQLHANRALELICLDDREKICTNCALFGNHKKHNIISEEDFMKEIEVKAEILIELFELIDNWTATFTDASFSSKFTNLNERSRQKREAVSNQVKEFIQELISNIKKSEQDILKRISNNFEAIDNKIKETLEIPNEIISKAEAWKSDVQMKLDKLNEISDSNNTNGFTNDETAKLIEINVTNQETIANAEEITNELEKIKSLSTEEIENLIYNFGVEFNYENALKLNNLVHIIQYKEGEKLEDSPKRRRKSSIETSINKSNTNRNSNTVQNMPVNNNISMQSIATNTSETIGPYFAVTENESIPGIPNSCNQSFLNMSEDSAIIRVNNLITNKNAEINKVKENPIPPKTRNSNGSMVYSSNNPNFNKNIQNKNKPTLTPTPTPTPTPSTNYNNNLNNINVNSTGANTMVNVNPSINNAKMTGCNKMEKIEKIERGRVSPTRDEELSKSPTPDRDKIVFIKSQFKNEIANFTGYGKFINIYYQFLYLIEISEVGTKIISEILNNSNKSNNPYRAKEIKLTKTNLNDECAMVILRSLETNGNIISLNIAKNHLTDRCMDTIISLLNKNKILKTFYLSNNNFSTLVKDRIKSYAAGVKIFI
jgi:hypothetical protein